MNWFDAFLQIATVDDFKAFLEVHPVVVVDFYADWCEKCPAMLASVEDVSVNFPDVPFIKVDIDTVPELKDFAKIKAVPMVVLYRKGKVRDFMFGTPDTEKLDKKIRTLLAAQDIQRV